MSQTSRTGEANNFSPRYPSSPDPCTAAPLLLKLWCASSLPESRRRCPEPPLLSPAPPPPSSVPCCCRDAFTPLLVRVMKLLRGSLGEVVVPFLSVHEKDDGMPSPEGSRMLYKRAQRGQAAHPAPADVPLAHLGQARREPRPCGWIDECSSRARRCRCPDDAVQCWLFTSQLHYSCFLFFLFW